MGVNVTAAQFKSGRLVPTVKGALQASGLASDLLCIEITEQNQLADTEQTRATIAALKELGVLVAIDDFGTGYSSLGYISRLRPDELEVDRSLVSEVDVDAERAGLVVAALAMARSLHLVVVAEGVETEAEQAFLQAHGSAWRRVFACTADPGAGVRNLDGADGRRECGRDGRGALNSKGAAMTGFL
jgi:EAL domain-containing protein (putative c-di-GMP-specific phosphodiesterase class I)